MWTTLIKKIIIMKHFTNIISLEDLKKQYRKLAIANHPDKGENTDVMQEINVEFDVLFKIWQNEPSKENNVETTTGETAQEEEPLIINEREKHASEAGKAIVNTRDNNITNNKEERKPMNPVAFMAFISCIQKRAIEKGYLHARDYVKEKLSQYSIKFIQLKYIAVMLAEYKKRNGDNPMAA